MNHTFTMLARNAVLKQRGMIALLGLSEMKNPSDAGHWLTAGSSSAKRVLSSARPLPVDHDGEEGEEDEWRPWNPLNDHPRRPAATSHPVNGRASFTVSDRSRESRAPSVIAAADRALQAASSDGAKATEESPRTLAYPGGTPMPIVSRLHIVTPEEDVPRGIWPVFRLMVRCRRKAHVSTFSRAPGAFAAM
jgi:hypothetical protein